MLAGPVVCVHLTIDGPFRFPVPVGLMFYGTRVNETSQ